MGMGDEMVIGCDSDRLCPGMCLAIADSASCTRRAAMLPVAVLCFLFLRIYSTTVRLVKTKKTGATTTRAMVHDVSHVSEPMSKVLYVRNDEAWESSVVRGVSHALFRHKFWVFFAEQKHGNQQSQRQHSPKLIKYSSQYGNGSMPAKSRTPRNE